MNSGNSSKDLDKQQKSYIIDKESYYFALNGLKVV